MNTDQKIAIARIAADMTLSIFDSKNGSLMSLRIEKHIPNDASILAVFDAVNAHLLDLITDE